MVTPVLPKFSKRRGFSWPSFVGTSYHRESPKTHGDPDGSPFVPFDRMMELEGSRKRRKKHNQWDSIRREMRNTPKRIKDQKGSQKPIKVLLSRKDIEWSRVDDICEVLANRTTINQNIIQKMLEDYQISRNFTTIPLA